MSRVAVVGAGTMGSGIAQVFSQRGWDTVLLDVAPELLDKARGTIRTNLERQVEKGTLKLIVRDTVRTELSELVATFRRRDPIYGFGYLSDY